MALTEDKDIQLYLRAVGSQVQWLRLRKGWSQEKLAEVSGINQSLVSRVEHGETGLALAMLYCVAQALGKLPHELLRDADKVFASCRYADRTAGLWRALVAPSVAQDEDPER